MRTKPTQADRVMRALVIAGQRGITQSEWLAPAGGDGLGRITRVAARVKELRDEGHVIETVGERHGFAVYRLVPSSGRLFEEAA